MMKSLYFAFLLLFLKSFQSSGLPGSAKFRLLEESILREGHNFNYIISHPTHCSALLENDGEIFKLLFRMIDGENNHYYHKYLILITKTCKDNVEVFKKAVKVAVGNESLISSLYADLRLAVSDANSLKLYKVMFEECAHSKTHHCVSLFREELCRLTDSDGRNILHIAALNDDAQFFDMANHCQLLINEKDFEGKFPMEYVESVELFKKFNEKWLEVAKTQFLSLQSSSKRLEICTRFGLNSDGTPTIEVNDEDRIPLENRIHLNEAFNATIESVEDVYSHFLKMKVNLLEGKGRDPSGMILEWLIALLNDIFSQEEISVKKAADVGISVVHTMASTDSDLTADDTETTAEPIIDRTTSTDSDLSTVDEMERRSDTDDTEITGNTTVASESPVESTIPAVLEPFPDLFTLEKSETTGEFEHVPTWKYKEDAYEFVGKILAIARYFGLGHNIKLRNDPDFLKIIQTGADKMKFLRLETHELDGLDSYVLKGRKIFVQISIRDNLNRILMSIRGTNHINHFKKAFESLSDIRKIKFLSLFLNEEEFKNGKIKIDLKDAVDPNQREYIVGPKRTDIQFMKFEEYEEYADYLQRITD